LTEDGYQKIIKDGKIAFQRKEGGSPGTPETDLSRAVSGTSTYNSPRYYIAF